MPHVHGSLASTQLASPKDDQKSCVRYYITFLKTDSGVTGTSSAPQESKGDAELSSDYWCRKVSSRGAPTLSSNSRGRLQVDSMTELLREHL